MQCGQLISVPKEEHCMKQEQNGRRKRCIGELLHHTHTDDGKNQLNGQIKQKWTLRMELTPIGHEKKLTWKRVKYRKKTRGKKCIPCADQILWERQKEEMRW
jgi:hypothetical protein